MGTPALSMHKSTILSSSINSKIPSSKGVSILSLLKGDFQKAREMHYYLFDLFKILFIETNPIPLDPTEYIKDVH